MGSNTLMLLLEHLFKKVIKDYKQGLYRVFIKYCVFPYNFLNFLNSASSAAALVFYLPGVCTHIDTEGKQSPENILKSSKKHNI